MPINFSRNHFGLFIFILAGLGLALIMTESPFSCLENSPLLSEEAGNVSASREFSTLLGLPDVPVPQDNPLTTEKVSLGRQLFFDNRLSEDGSTSCATCHRPERGFGDGLSVSQGVHGRKGRRNTPTLVNVAFQIYQFWDGRSISLEDQALAPLQNRVEMGSSVDRVLRRLNTIPEYREEFQRVFKGRVTRIHLARALASYERTILSGNSAYDQFAAGSRSSLSSLAQEGLQLFEGKAHCQLCHAGYNLSDGLFHNLGVGWDGATFADLARFSVSGITRDRGAFKTPTLRQVAETAPYMHDGSLANLEEVVEFYSQGGRRNPYLDVLIQPLKLNSSEKAALVEFLKSLTNPDLRMHWCRPIDLCKLL